MKKIWASGFEKTMNCTMAFSYILPDKFENLSLRICAANTYRVFVNDKLVSYGPQRTAHGYGIINYIDLKPHLADLKNYLTVEVASYHINTFYTLDEDPFFAAEICDGTEVIADSEDFECYILDDRIQKVQRYSPQRPFVEVYSRYDRQKLYCGQSEYRSVKTVSVNGKELIEAQLPECNFSDRLTGKVIEAGNVFFSDGEGPLSDRLFTADDPRRKGFSFTKCDVRLSSELLKMSFEAEGTFSDKVIDKNRYVMLDFGRNATGFPELHINVKRKATVYFIFDEIFWDELYEQEEYKDKVKQSNAKPLIFCRAKGCCNAIKWELKSGSYQLMSFDPYTFQYGKIVVTEGEVVLDKASILLYENTDALKISYKSDDKELERIFSSAVNTLSQNAVDVLTDCPSRERAGWLCDSYFSAKAEKLMTGKNLTEKNLLRAYLLAGPQAGIPEGMIPMCYPADTSNFIPNWAMWYVVELEDYFLRSNDIEMIEQSRSNVYKILDFFKPFENEFSFLENLTGWVFVEWSKANDFVKHINIPSNILYYGMLMCVGRLYDDKELVLKAEKLKKNILRFAYNGKYFCDQLIRENDRLKLTENYTETCQYYAFYFDVADNKNFARLYDTMFSKLGFSGNERKSGDLHPANAFIGKYLCMLYLTKRGRIHLHIDEIKSYLKKMSDRSQTLWELDQSTSSCCHGFAAVVGNVIATATVGFLYVDETEKSVVLWDTFDSRNKSSIEIPFSEGLIKIKCYKEKREIILPDNTAYRIKILKSDTNI